MIVLQDRTEVKFLRFKLIETFACVYIHGCTFRYTFSFIAASRHSSGVHDIEEHPCIKL